MSSKKIRVLVVDDSAVVRKLVSDALLTDPEIEVVGTAIDPYFAKDKIIELQPDVVTLDIEMPRMDGLTFLRLIMERRPMPVIIMSSLTQAGSNKAMEALQLGAVDVLGKPAGSYSFGDLGPQLIQKIKAAACARLRRPGTPPISTAMVAKPPVLAGGSRGFASRQVVLLGASTGGTEALREVLTALPADIPPIAIVQHIPAMFSRSFAERLNQLCAFEVREAVDGDRLTPGLALVAPGNFHMMLQRNGDHYRVRVTDGPQIWHQRPAVDLLFRSAADCAGPHALAGVLTGMGKDGADGLLALRRKGAQTFAQDEESSVVYGMPRVAWECGAAQSQISLGRIAEHIVRATAAPRSALATSLTA